ALWGVRLFPTLAGVAILLLCCAMARNLGGGAKAIFLAGIAVLAFLPFYRNHTLFQPVAFDQLFWTLGFYLATCWINTEQSRYLWLLGITLGFGLLNKYTMLIWAFGLFVGLFFYKKGKIYRSPTVYLAASLALLLVLPNIIWQWQNDFPLLSHLAALKERQLDGQNPWAFGLTQLEMPFTFAISAIGVYALIWGKHLKKYRSIGIAAVTIFATMWILQSKAYYVFALYPVMFAAGGVKMESLLAKQKSIWMYLVAALTFLPTIPFIPEMTPLLPIEKFVKFANLEVQEKGRVELTGDYADMFGWEEQVALVDSIYRSMSPREQNNCVIWAENYGEAGAVKILGNKYGLPNPISRHGSFWSWGYDQPDAMVWISLGNEAESVNRVFSEVELVKMIYHPYAIGEENGIPLYICRAPKVDIPAWWKAYEPYIFN
ncbi:MAG: glycosyltransferase family 39 protein, partial [Bacteroidota bacterium]